MLIYESRARILQFKAGTAPTFPASARISASFEPRTPFGGETGKTRNTVVGQNIKAKASPSTGHFYMLAEEPLFPALDFSASVQSATFAVHGNEISVDASVTSLQDVADLLGALCYAFPGILNLYLPDSPYPLYAWGRVGAARTMP